MTSYTVTKKTIEASSPRADGSTLFVGEPLQLVYNRYKTTRAIPEGAIKYNLVFAHATGMNKSVWKYHINKLYENPNRGWYLDSVIAFDAVGHGDSAVLNADAYGWINVWNDNARDLSKIVRHEQALTGDFQNNITSRNIAIGHSFGGFSCFMAGIFEPNLFDSTILFEPVIWLDERQTARYLKILTKLGQLIIDDFDSKEEFDEYFRKFSFFKNQHPKVLQDFLDDELLQVKDDEGNTHYKTKSSTFSALTCYRGAALSVPLLMQVQQSISIPVHHVIGADATWTAREGVDYFRSHLPKHLLTTVDVEKGEHLLVGEKPDETVQIISDYVAKRQSDIKDKYTNFPENKFNKDKSKIKEYVVETLLNGDITELPGYDFYESQKSKL